MFRQDQLGGQKPICNGIQLYWNVTRYGGPVSDGPSSGCAPVSVRAEESVMHKVTKFCAAACARSPIIIMWNRVNC